MTTTSLVALLAALLALALPAGASAAADPLDPVQWRMPAPTSGKAFAMTNAVNGSPLGHVRRTGVDLGWATSGDWIVFRQSGSGTVRDHRGTVTSLETVALFNTKARRFLGYERQSVGINLDWAKSPSYQWRIDHVPTRGAASLYNVPAGDYLVHGSRTWGVNLQWLKDRGGRGTGYGPGTVHTTRVTLDAQPRQFGHVPFRGTLRGRGAELLDVINAPVAPELKFLKRFREADECGNPYAYVSLAPGGKLDMSQMDDVWGSGVPPFYGSMTFLACADTPWRSITLTVRYRVMR